MDLKALGLFTTKLINEGHSLVCLRGKSGAEPLLPGTVPIGDAEDSLSTEANGIDRCTSCLEA